MKSVLRRAAPFLLVFFLLSGCASTPPVNSTQPSSDPEATTSNYSEIPNSSASAPSGDSTFSIHFINVGQADAALVECDGHYMLIDGGNKADSSRIYSVLKQAGAEHLDLVVATHAHEDHIGGLPSAFQYTTADLTLCPVTEYNSSAFEDFAKYAEEKGNGIYVPSVGEEYSLGSATVTILGVNGGEDTNDTSIVLKIQYGETSFLFAADAERDAEQAILDTGADISATVLKVGHHGASTSTGYLFLREIMPEYAVISVGEGNSYGHPTEETLSRLRDADVIVYRTDIQGDIRCTSDGKTVSFQVDANQTADTLFEAGSSGVQPESSDTSVEGPSFILNTSSLKFHTPSCESVAKMNERNKETFYGSREDLLAKGYSPCGSCDP